MIMRELKGLRIAQLVDLCEFGPNDLNVHARIEVIRDNG